MVDAQKFAILSEINYGKCALWNFKQSWKKWADFTFLIYHWRCDWLRNLFLSVNSDRIIRFSRSMCTWKRQPRMRTSLPCGLVAISLLWFIHSWGVIFIRNIKLPSVLTSSLERPKPDIKCEPVFQELYKHENILNFSSLDQSILEGRLSVVSAGRAITGYKIVIGIPSVRRNYNVIYVLETLTSLVSNLSQSDKREMLIIVFIAEPSNNTYVWNLTKKITVKFLREFNFGLIEIIYPEPELYPDLSNLKQSYGDSRTRVTWRVKQVITSLVGWETMNLAKFNSSKIIFEFSLWLWGG